MGLAQCINLLQEIFQDANTTMSWLTYHHPLLCKSPMEAILDNDTESVIKILKSMKDGGQN